MVQHLQSSESEVRTDTYPRFVVDSFTEGNDLVYHFYPNPIEKPFISNFHMLLEEAFIQVLPDTADVRAQYLEQYEMAAFERTLRPEDRPHSSYWVRVMELAGNPMSDRFLRDALFETLNELTR